jgi:hypothetical protein
MTIAMEAMNEARKEMRRLHGARRAERKAMTPKKSATRKRAHEALDMA